MKLAKIDIRPSDLWRWEGTIDRGPYLTLGITLFLVKFLFDRFVSAVFFHRQWSLFDYFIPARAFDLASLPASELSFYGTMLLLSIPFAWTGCVLSLRRLRAARLPLPLVVLFFIPAVNLIFFKVLSSAPTKEDEDVLLTDQAQQGTAKPWTIFPVAGEEKQGKALAPAERRQVYVRLREQLAEMIPEDDFGAAVFSILVPQSVACLITILCVNVLRNYGWSLFVALPFALPLACVLLYGLKRQRSLASCLVVGWISMALLGGLLFLLAVEGAICLLMALPLAFVIATVAAALGFCIQYQKPRAIETTKMIVGLALVMPVLMGAEFIEHAEAPSYAVCTAIDIDAPPDKVWRNVVSFAEMPPPHELMFKFGVAHPVRARIFGSGRGAVRHCTFSTGTFVEPISVWDEPRLLKFAVTDQPEPMRELSFDSRIHPTHLNHFFVSSGGQFLLVPTGKGGTHLEGTTWYQHHMWPAPYWRLWSDYIIHQIHLRVLRHIEHLSESAG